MALYVKGHTCGLIEDTRIPRCWGYNGAGESVTTPDFECKTVVTGMRYSLALAAVDNPERKLEKDDILAWGDLPEGPTWPPGKKWKMISSGDSTACGITLDGIMHCWGSWTLGTGMLPNPVQNATFANWRHVGVGTLNMCAVQNITGFAVCWGDTSNGINDIPSVGEGWKAISPGNIHACGITLSDTLHCWGAKEVSGFYPAKAGLPKEVNDLGGGGWATVAAGYRHTCAVSNHGMEYCWGKYGNFRTQVGVPGWSVMRNGNIYHCSVNGTYHGTCTKTRGDPGPNAICDVMSREDIPQLMIHSQLDVIVPAFKWGMADICRNQCCLPAPEEYSIFERPALAAHMHN